MDEKKIKVLLIEDNPVDTPLIQKMLTGEVASPFILECAGRLSEGIERLDKADFDVVLLDLGLPDSFGLETIGKIRAQAARVPVVVLTGQNDKTLSINALQQGAQDYVLKEHINGPALWRCLRYAIERKQIQKALWIKDRVIESSVNPIANGTQSATSSKSALAKYGACGETSFN